MKNFINKNLVIKRLIFSKKKLGGRNFLGLITVRGRGQGHKKKYRFVDYFRVVREVPGKIRRLEYDPNRTSFLSLVCYKNSVLSYILSTESSFMGEMLINSISSLEFLKSGSTLFKNSVIGIVVHNLEIFPNFGGKMLRSAGSSGQVLKKLKQIYVLVRLKSSEYRIFHENCFFSYGIVSNSLKKFEKLYKAGQTRYKGFKPLTRGEAKNPVDHPHGGNTSGGKQPRTPQGILTLGLKTRNKSKISDNLIFKRKN